MSSADESKQEARQSSTDCERTSGEALCLERRPDPCIIVIFGASGDLTGRKLIPALYNLYISGGLWLRPLPVV